MLQSPWLAALITLICCLAWMKFISFLTGKGIVSSTTSRKIIHIGTGPLFLLCWLLFPDAKVSRYLATLVPMLIVLQLALIGFRVVRDPVTTNSMARSGNTKELLKGPFFYGIVFVILTIFFWKSAVAIIPLMILCGGDGIAELAGSKIKSPHLPWNKKKTLAGSTAMFLGGTALSLILLLVYQLTGDLSGDLGKLVLPVLVISLISTFVESISPSDVDNLTVPAAALLLSIFFV